MESLYEKNKVLYFLAYLVIFIIVAMILWPLFDLIVANVFTHETFAWNIKGHLIQPVIFGVIFTIIEFVWRLYKDKKKK